MDNTNQKGKEVLQIIGAIVVVALISLFYVEKVIAPKLQEEIVRLRLENEATRSELNKLQSEVKAKLRKDTPSTDKSGKKGNETAILLGKIRNNEQQPWLVDPSRVNIAMLQDYTIEQDRIAIISDLMALASKAQQYYNTTVTFNGGGRSFVGLTADATGLTRLASLAFTDNANGTYSIKASGNATRLVLHGVGKVALPNGTFPTYDMTVTSQSQTPSRLN